MGYKFNPFMKYTMRDFCHYFPLEEYFKDLLNKEFDILQVIGGSGSGKSSLLYQYLQFFRENNLRFYFHYTRESEDFKDIKIPPCEVLVLDEVQKMRKDVFKSKLDLQTLKETKLIIGSHMDHISWFNEIGMDFKVITVYLHELFPKRLKYILSKCIEVASFDSPRHSFTDEGLDIMESFNSFETARCICYDIFTNPDIPPVIGPEIIRISMDSILPNRETIIKRSY
jgi:GTPase SAR1 family protein